MQTSGPNDYLDEDPIIPSQCWALVSVISPATVKTEPGFNWDIRMLKIRCVCETDDQANKMAEHFHKIDPYHHVFKMRMGRWGCFDDRDDCAEEIDYGDERMNTMMKSFKDQQSKAEEYETERRVNAKKNAVKHQKMLEERRKKQERKAVKKINSTTDRIVASELVTENVNAMQNLSEDELKKKLAELNTPLTVDELVQNNIVKVDDKKEIIDHINEDIVSQEKTIDRINSEYAKVQEQLAKLKK